MKSIFLFLFVASNLFSMQQIPNCFYAHQKFLAMIQTCKHKAGSSILFEEREVEKRQECIAEFFKQFQKECLDEEYVNKQSSGWFKVV